MRGLARSLSARSEYAIVLLSAFGYFTFSSLAAVLRPTSIQPISQIHLEFLLIYESALLLLLGAFLYVRGWTTARLGISPTAKDTLLGVAKSAGSTTAGVNVSVAIRLLYHLYQGGIGVIGIIPFGLIFAWWYARIGRLWPLFVAHGLTDAAGLLQFFR
jgi:hypothetical protein